MLKFKMDPSNRATWLAWFFEWT